MNSDPPQPAGSRSDITLALQQAASDAPQSTARLLELVYPDLRSLAASWMARENPGQTLQATALVHEAWLKLVGDKDRTWENRAHFFGAAALAMRHILVDIARKKTREKHGGGSARLDLGMIEVADTSPPDELLRINDAVEKLELEDPEQARIVVLKFFGGLTNEEVAAHLGIGERTVYRHWVCAKARLCLLAQQDE